MKRWTPEQEQLAKNHVPTVKGNCDVFLKAFDAKALNDDDKVDFLLAVTKSMIKDLKEVKDMLKAK